MKKLLCLSLFLAAVCSLVLVSQPAYAQDWAEELRSLLGRISSEVDGGYIEDVSIESETTRTVYLRVTYSGVENSSDVVLTAQVLGVSLRALDGCHADSVSLSGPSGSASVPIEYTGTSEAFSMFLRVVLFDRGNGTIVDTRRIRFSRRWESGGGSGESEADTGQPAAEESSAPPPEEREPIVIEPRRVGNTPEIREEAEEPEEETQPQEQPEESRPTETVAEMRPAETTLSNVQLATAAHISIVPNFFALAPKAKWANDKMALEFGGKPADKRGFATNHNTATLSDNRTHRFVLQTHPRWFKNGQIIGRYEKVSIPKDAKFFETGLAFIRGGKAGDVTFYVTFRANEGGRTYSLLRQRLRYADGVVSKRMPIPPQIRGKVGTVTMMVHAGATSAQDWAVWVNPRITK